MSGDYSYALLYAKAGGSEKWIVYKIVVASAIRPLIGNEALIYYRECKTGISSFAYWLSKNLYSVIVVYIYALCYAVSFYINDVILSDWKDLTSNAFYVGWYWSGGAMLLSTLIQDQSIVTLALIFWPSLEQFYDGTIGHQMKMTEIVAMSSGTGS